MSDDPTVAGGDDSTSFAVTAPSTTTTVPPVTTQPAGPLPATGSGHIGSWLLWASLLMVAGLGLLATRWNAHRAH